jgi:hypothetical protein
VACQRSRAIASSPTYARRDRSSPAKAIIILKPCAERWLAMPPRAAWARSAGSADG